MATGAVGFRKAYSFSKISKICLISNESSASIVQWFYPFKSYADFILIMSLAFQTLYVHCSWCPRYSSLSDLTLQFRWQIWWYGYNLQATTTGSMVPGRYAFIKVLQAEKIINCVTILYYHITLNEYFLINLKSKNLNWFWWWLFSFQFCYTERGTY